MNKKMIMSGGKYCNNCERTFLNPKKHFNKDRSRKDGLSFYCIECSREITQYYEDKKKKPLVQRTCAWKNCNKTFKTRDYKKRYCCQSHRTMAYQERVGKEQYKFKQAFRRKLKRTKEQKRNSNTRWSDEDVNKLFELREKGISFAKIAVQLQRGADACLNKYHKEKGKR